MTKIEYFHFNNHIGELDDDNIISFLDVFEEHIECNFTHTHQNIEGKTYIKKQAIKTNKKDITNIINQIKPDKWAHTEYKSAYDPECGSYEIVEELYHDVQIMLMSLWSF